MEELRNNFLNFIKENGITLKGVSKKTEIPYYTLSRFKTGPRKLPKKYIDSLTNYLNDTNI